MSAVNIAKKCVIKVYISLCSSKSLWIWCIGAYEYLYVACLGEGHDKTGSKITISTDSGEYPPYSNISHAFLIMHNWKCTTKWVICLPEIQKSHHIHT